MVDRKALLKEQQPFDAKKDCWIPNEKTGYVKGEIVSTKGDEVTVMNTEPDWLVYNPHYQLLILWVVTPTDERPINWFGTINSIHKNHNNQSDKG